MPSANVEQATEQRAPRSLTLADRGVLELIAAVATFVAYLPSLAFRPVWDDTIGVFENPFVTSWPGLARYFAQPFWSHVPGIAPVYYRPLFLLWFRGVFALFGESAFAFHLTTVLVHVGVTLLVFAIAEKLFRDRWLAFFASLLFGVHPVHVESVAWISGVADPLLALYYFGSLYALIRAFETNALRARWYTLSLVLFAAGLLQKEPTVTLPVLIAAYVMLFTDAAIPVRVRRTVLVLVPFGVITALYFLVRVRVLHYTAFQSTPIDVLTMVKTWPFLLAFYLRLLFWPVRLSPFYDVSYVQRVTQPAFWAPMLLLIAIIAAIVWWMRTDRANARTVAFLVIFAVVPLGPAMYIRAFRQGDYAHDRYTYLSSAAVCMLAMLALHSVGRRVRMWHSVERGRLIVAGVTAIAVACGVLTISQSQYWGSEILLYTHSLAIAPNNNQALGNFGVALLNSGHIQEGFALLHKAVETDEKNWRNWFNMGVARYRTGDFAGAYRDFDRAVSINPGHPDVWLYFGAAAYRLGRLEEATHDVRNAIALQSNWRNAHFWLGVMLREAGDLAGARREFETELRNHPDHKDAKRELGALASAGK